MALIERNLGFLQVVLGRIGGPISGIQGRREETQVMEYTLSISGRE
jgi:hypothetical protein